MTKKQKGIIALLFVALTWGILPIFPRFLSQSLDIFQQNYLRQASAFIFSLLFFSKQFSWNKIQNIPKNDWILLFIRSFSYYIIGTGAMTFSLIITKISNVMFIQALPIYALLAVLLFHEKITFQKLFYIFVSLVGVFIVSIKDFSTIFSFGFGELLSLLSIFGFAFGMIARKWQTDYLSDRELSIIQLFFSSILSFIASLFFQEGMPVWNGDIKLIFIVFAAGLIISGMNYFLSYGYKHVEAIIAGPILTLETVLSIVFAFLLFHEIPSTKEFIGGLLILISVISIQLIEYRKN